MSRRILQRVVLVGRPNVGKSTLFNRLTGARRSIVTSIAGTTRDVITHPVTWERYRFEVTDTGGLFGASEDPLHELVKEQGARALKVADLIVMVVDGREGLIPGDQDIAKAAREVNVPIILAINKSDDRRARAGALELYRLGINTVVEISAEHGDAVGDLLEEIVKQLNLTPEPLESADAPEPPPEEDAGDTETAIAIVGRPNAGKSSLVNHLLREDRMIVSEVPGTTRDSVDSMLQWHRRTFRIVDTAGIRKPGKVSKSQVESVSVLLAKRAIERADVVVLVIDATVGPTDQDGAIAGAAKEAGRGIIIAANKWDLMKDKGEDAAKVFDENLRYQLKFLDFAPILHISAATGERTPKLLEMVDKVAAATRTRVPTGELNRFFERITTQAPPVTSSKRNVRVMYASQTSVAPPTFVLFANSQVKLHFSYERFLENRLRESYGFEGSPIRIQVRGRPDSRAERRTAAERAPDRRKPVKKGPGSKPSNSDRARDSRRGAKRGTKQGSKQGAARTVKRGVKPGTKVASAKVYTEAEVAQAKRELFKAAEVCDVVQVQPYVLRSWEAEFPQIGQAPTGGGPRVYRRSDVQLVLRIKQLVFEEGLTLSGARRRLEEDSGDNSNGAAVALVEEVVGDRVRDGLKELRSGLESILEMLSNGGDGPPKSHRAIPVVPRKKPTAKAKSKK